MQNTLSRLCSLCSTIDFSALVWPALHNREDIGARIDLGEAQAIRIRASVCDLCRLIICRLDQVDDPDIEKNVHDRCWLGTTLFEPAQLALERTRSGKTFQAYWLYIGVVPATCKGFIGPLRPDSFYKPRVRNPSPLDATVQSRPWSLMHLQGCIDPMPHVDVFCQAGHLLTSSIWEHRYSGRLRNDTINLNLPRFWLQTCIENHKKDCSPVERPIVDNFRVIDVEDMAIRRASVKCQYVALSYCWGSSSTVLLNHENVERFAKAQALSGIALPNTIADAIIFVRGLGARYLWVDALCIVQDDTALLLQQIPQMAYIYEQSICTIIAAAAKTADDGLAGVRNGTRTINSDTICLPGMNLITAAEDPKLSGSTSDLRRASLDSYRWRSRAWTLQEEIASRRKIFVEADRIFWCCSHGIMTEETVKEITTMRRSAQNHGRKRAAKTFLEIDSMSENIMDSDFTPDLYEGLVGYYSKRQLSFPSDAVNAISGILLQIDQKHSINFRWGHPCPWFVSSLLWSTNYSCSRNLGVQKITCSNGSEAEFPFPSWSWAAWIGELDGDRVFFKHTIAPNPTNAQDWCPLVYCCTLDIDGRPTPYLCINAESYESQMEKRSLHSWVDFPQHIDLRNHTSLFAGDTGLLQFWTSVATLYLGERPTTLRRATGNHELLNSYAVSVDATCWIQSVESLAWADTSRYEQYPAPIISRRNEFLRGVHEVQAVAICTYSKRIELLIVGKLDTMYYRQGVGSTSEDRWLSSNPEWLLVTLG